MEVKVEQHLPKKTVLRVKRKRNETSHDVIALEAHRPPKQQKQINTLLREIKKLDVSKQLKYEFNKEFNIPNNEETLKWKSFDTGMKRIFRYIGSQESLEFDPIYFENLLLDENKNKNINTQNDQKTVDLKSGQFKTTSFESYAPDTENKRIPKPISSLSKKEYVAQRSTIKLIDLVDSKEGSSGYGGVQLPIVKSSKNTSNSDSDDCVFDYYYMDEETPTVKTDVSVYVPIESFREDILDEPYIYENEYDDSDKEFDSDDSQNRDWGFYDSDISEESEEETKSSSGSDDEYDPYEDDDDDDYGFYM